MAICNINGNNIINMSMANVASSIINGVAAGVINVAIMAMA
jgi:hypothetical protein